MFSLAQEFERRFQADFPEYSENVRFLETLPKDLPSSNMGALARLKDLFREKTQAPDLILFDTLRRTLPNVPPDHLQALCEDLVEGSFGTHYFTLPNPPLSPFVPLGLPERHMPPSPLCIVVGPDRSRSIADLLTSTALGGESMAFQSKARAEELYPFVYDHETGHALHTLYEDRFTPEEKQAEAKRIEDLTRDFGCPLSTHETNFRERVADVYAAFRAAAAGTPEVCRSIAIDRTLALRHENDLSHYTVPALEAAMRDIAENKLPDTPQTMFARALTLAQEYPLHAEDVRQVLRRPLPVIDAP